MIPTNGDAIVSANDAWIKIMLDLAQRGAERSPRGMKTLEIENYSICIDNPRKRLVSNPIRRMSLPYAFGELLWYLSGRNDLNMMQYYSKKLKSFSDDGETLNSAYGYRMFGRHPMLPFNQWRDVINKLRNDPDTRQAIIHLHTPNNQPTKDEVCTLTLQFMIRDGKLDMITNMRSNDVVWGFTYDVFCFTSIQEFIANELEIDVGKYFHNAASMHIYQKDFKLLDQVMVLKGIMKHFVQYDIDFSFEGATIHSKEFTLLKVAEIALRGGVATRLINDVYDCKAFEVMKDVFIKYRNHKCGDRNIFEYDNLFHCMLRNQFATTKLDDSMLYIVEGCDGAGKTTYCMEKVMDNEFTRDIDWDRVHCEKPSPDFSPIIYYNLLLSQGHRIFDRAYLSEMVYARYFQRPSFLSDLDISMLNRILVYRKAKVILMTTTPATMYDSLDADDSNNFCMQDLNDIDRLYHELIDWFERIEIKTEVVRRKSNV